jgi:hypothetical protein
MGPGGTPFFREPRWILNWLEGWLGLDYRGAMERLGNAMIALLAMGSIAVGEPRPAAQISVLVIDETGKPVSEAEASMSTFHHWEPGEAFGKDVASRVVGKTDETGIGVLKQESLRGECWYSVKKEGFYRGGSYAHQFKEAKDGKWEPWNPTLKVELRRILNPIPLITRKVGSSVGRKRSEELPAFDRPVGFDLEVSDWTAPFGKGVHADVVLTLKGRATDGGKPYNATLEVTFSNPKDGLVLHEGEDPHRGNQLRVPHLAPENGYQQRLVKRQSRTDPATPYDGAKILDDRRTTENYFLRVRTVTNEKGEIVSANYGKIYGGFEWFPTGSLRFHYYFNPKANDRNLEFDPKRNLLKTEEAQRVFEP